MFSNERLCPLSYVREVHFSLGKTTKQLSSKTLFCSNYTVQSNLILPNEILMNMQQQWTYYFLISTKYQPQSNGVHSEHSQTVAESSEKKKLIFNTTSLSPYPPPYILTPSVNYYVQQKSKHRFNIRQQVCKKLSHVIQKKYGLTLCLILNLYEKKIERKNRQ